MKHTMEVDPPGPPDDPTPSGPVSQDPDNPGDPAVLQFFKNPWVGITATICTIISIPLGFYFFAASQRSREAMFYVHPQRALIVQAGGSSQLKVLYKDTEVRTDVVAVQVSFWNNGREPIRTEHILAPVLFSIIQKTPILEATIQKTFREVSQIHLDESDLRNGSLGVSWKILEQGDGAVIQLIMAGKASDFVAKGTIEGQSSIKVIQYSAQPKNHPFFPFAQMDAFRRRMMMVVLLSMLGMFTYNLIQSKKSRRRWNTRRVEFQRRRDTGSKVSISAGNTPFPYPFESTRSRTDQYLLPVVQIVTFAMVFGLLATLVYSELTTVVPPI